MTAGRTAWHRDPMATTTSLSRSSSRSCRGRRWIPRGRHLQVRPAFRTAPRLAAAAAAGSRRPRPPPRASSIWPTSSRCGSRSWRRPKTDARADRTLFESEAAAADGTVPARGLLLEVARLVEAEGDADGALAAARAAFAADPSLAVTLWSLRRLLARAGLWQELADAYGTAAEAVVAAAGRRGARGAHRADLLRGAGARAGGSPRARHRRARQLRGGAARPIPITSGALLALLLAGARRQETAIVATALGGLARRAEGARRAALAIEEARAWRQPLDGAARPTARRARWPCSTAELRRARIRRCRRDGAGRARSAHRAPTRRPTSRLRALAEIAGRVGGAWTASSPSRCGASARGCRRSGSTRPPKRSRRWTRPRGWTRRTPSSRWIGCSSSTALAGGAAADALAPELIDAGGDDDEAVDLALLHAELASRGRPGRRGARRAWSTPRVRGRRGARADLRALELVLAIRRAGRRARCTTRSSPRPSTRRARGPARRRRRPTRWSRPRRIRQWRLERLGRRGGAVPAGAGPVADARAGDARAGRHVAGRRPRRGGGGAAGEDAHLGGGRSRRCSRCGRARRSCRSTPTSSAQPDKAGGAPARPGRAGAEGRRAPRAPGGHRDVPRRAPATSRSGSTTCWRSPSSAGDPAVAIALKVEAGRTLLAGPTAEAQRAAARPCSRELVHRGRERAGGVRAGEHAAVVGGARAS